MDLLFRFHCPECGFGDDELGHLIAVEEVHCTVCYESGGARVRLRRWTDEERAAYQARLRVEA